jgi:hypothetical protein
MARPYNHPDNLKPNGQPRMSEDNWALSESLREGGPSDPVSILEWKGRPANQNEALHQLALRIKELETQLATLQPSLADKLKHEEVGGLDASQLKHEEVGGLDASQFVYEDKSKLCKADFQSYDSAKWETQPQNKWEAINRLADAVFAINLGVKI